MPISGGAERAFSSDAQRLSNYLEQNDVRSIVCSPDIVISSLTQTVAKYNLTPLQFALKHCPNSTVESLLTTFFTHSIPESSTSVASTTSNIDDVISQICKHLQPHEKFVNSNVSATITSSPAQSNGSHHFNGTGVLSTDETVARVEKALDAIRAGEFVVIVDGEDRENEGDLIIAAEKATPEKLAYMVNETSGLICVGITSERAQQLQLPQMVVNNTESHQTAFTVSVDYRLYVSTGISAHDRAKTICALADTSISPEQLARPGHIFPLRARAGGVLERPGHTEASVDIARLAGLYPAAAMCEIVNKDGTMSRPDQLKQWSKQQELQMISIADLIYYRQKTGK